MQRNPTVEKKADSNKRLPVPIKKSNTLNIDNTQKSKASVPAQSSFALKKAGSSINQNNNAKVVSAVASKASSSNNVKKLDKPSAKYTAVKTADLFAETKKNKTNFAYVYSSGGIPCRIAHGSIKLGLKWDAEPSTFEYDPILVVCFEGLLETEHPYNFASRQCIRDMLSADGAKKKTIEVLPKIIQSLRLALSSQNDEIFGDTVKILEMLSNLVQEKLNQYLHFFLQQINKRSLNPKFKEIILDCLKTLEKNGGDEALKEIKKKIPTYVNN